MPFETIATPAQSSDFFPAGRRSWCLRSLALCLWIGRIVCAIGAPLACGQTESPFIIRTESREVVVPVVVLDRTHRLKTPTGRLELDEEIRGLTARDFHVFEDGMQQPVRSVAMELPNVRDVQDKTSHHLEYSFTPEGVWSSPELWPQTDQGPNVSLLPVYLVSFEPSPSSRGSCHRIQVKVKHKHATVYARAEYCNIRHPLFDPIGGTLLGRQMEEYGNGAVAEGIPISAQASSSTGNGRVRVTVKYPPSAINRKWIGVDLFAMVAVLGVVHGRAETPVLRFSDMASTVPWNFYRGPLPPDQDFLSKWEMAGIPAQYETQIELPAGDYDLLLVITDGEKFGRAKVPFRVGTPNRDLQRQARAETHTSQCLCGI